MTARSREPGGQWEADGYDLIARVRVAVPRLSTGTLDHIRGVLERALEDGGPDAEVLAALAEALREQG